MSATPGVSLRQLTTMILFVIGALLNGWGVRMLGGHSLAFSKPVIVAGDMTVEQFVDQNSQLLGV